MSASSDLRASCPTRAELAEFSTGGLTSGRRTEVALHARRCRECIAVMEVRDRPIGAKMGRALAIAMVAVVVLVSGWAILQSRRSEGPPIAALVRLTAGQRFVEGRLSGGFEWAPLQKTRGVGGLVADRWDLVRAVTEMREGVSAGSLDRKHAMGVAYLLLGQVDEGIRALELATEDAPRDARLLSDLAAALIERGKLFGHAQDLVRALDHAEEALTIDRGLIEAHFNKALAMQELGLREGAARWWEDYGSLDRSSPWAGEARQRRERLRGTTLAHPWPVDADAFARACVRKDKAEAERLVRLHPQDAAEAVLGDLGRWAYLAISDDKEVSASLDHLAVASAAVSAVTGDRMLENAVHEIRAADRLPARRLQLAKAHKELQMGRSAFDNLRAEQAIHQLNSARDTFTTLQSPMADVADLYRLCSAYFLTQPEKLLPEMDQLVEHASARGSRIIEARAHWLRATTLIAAGQKVAALDAVTKARDMLDHLGFAADAVFVRSILASTTWLLGRYAQSWEQHRASFRLLDAVTDPRRAQALLGSSAFEAEVEGHRRAALVLQEAALMFARRHNSAPDRCDATVWYARTAQLAGASAVAAAALDEGRALARDVTDATLRARYESELDIVQAKLELDSAPAQAAAMLDRALAVTKQDDRRLEIHFARAKAREKAEDSAGASQDYMAALLLAERQRSRINDPYLRISLFDTIWELAREIVRFEFDQGNPRRALILANRMRSTSVKARLPVPEDQVLPVLMRHLRTDQGVVLFAVLGDRTIAWVIRRDGIWPTTIGLSGHEVRRLVDEARRAVTDSMSPNSSGADEVLFRRVVDPLKSYLNGAAELVIVPDGSLHLVPWGALRDPNSGRRWVEDVMLAVAPSLSAITTPLRNRNDDPSNRVVAVGNPAFDRSVHPELADLPGAESEARAIGALYPASVVLTGGDATPQRVLEEAARASILHIAAHAVPHVTDPELSTIVLAPGGAVDSDGVLTAREILACDMGRLRLVVLAACRSGDGPLSRIEGPLSVARPFLENGAQAVAVSLWDFPDESGSKLAETLHRGVRNGLSPAAAMQRAAKECWSTSGMNSRACGSLQIILNGPWGEEDATSGGHPVVGARGFVLSQASGQDDKEQGYRFSQRRSGRRLVLRAGGLRAPRFRPERDLSGPQSIHGRPAGPALTLPRRRRR